MGAEKYIKLSDLYSIINKYEMPRDVRAQKEIEAAAIDLKNLQINCSEFPNSWIPCSERLPETDNYILLSFSNFSVPLVGRYEHGEDGGAFYVGDDTESCVSQDVYANAWMPLPKPYQTEEDEES